MAKLVGRNAKILIGGTELPQSNAVSISQDRDYMTARIFQDDTTNGSYGPWEEQIPGYRNWKIDITAYYDDIDDRNIKSLGTNSAIPVVVYENRTTTTRYWYGSAFFSISEDIGTNDVITVKMSGTGTGPLGRIPVPAYP